MELERLARGFVKHMVLRCPFSLFVGYGAELIEYGDNYDEAEAYAFQLADETGRTLVHAFEDNKIVVGRGTVGLEILLEQPDFDTLLVLAGGGGLICGVAVVAKAINPAIRVVDLQSHASPPWYYSFQEKKLVDVTYEDSLAGWVTWWYYTKQSRSSTSSSR